MNFELDAERHAVIKGRIMGILVREYPNGIDMVLLRKVLSNININLTPKELYAYIVYLRDIGYAVTKEVDIDKDDIWDILYVTATTRGINFYDGVLPEPDPGVLRV
jgi:hypothetical protein